MYIRINIREIPEIKAAFNARPNKKDSFDRWINRLDPTLAFHINGEPITPLAA